ncbi:phospholipid-transporting ATPase ABCA3-like [Physella acuta]|uniref:phospholipid-transporting ATPase ABCA3-like n=1 Tax=Physella acuta TaxID=109671 RepID=UPI0027DBABB0|nr:phospholipid-transporting ATPase ABCA3-like [Physella acuta]
MFTNLNSPHKTWFNCLLIIALNTIFNIFLLWYINNIYPGQYGIPRPYNFFLTRDYWRPPKEILEVTATPAEDPEFFEPPPSNLKPGIVVRKLFKMFGNKIAVNGINIDLYEGQITVLLGHNGAGKTTTINMVTGFLPPSSGTAIVQGHDVIRSTHLARDSIGMCPQYDILFSKLTCKEHLIFFLKLKGSYSPKVVLSVVERLVSVGLQDKVNCLASQLSGGQKRKLSLASAFCGDTRVVFLDEPSTGLDPAARQEMWAFLKTMREGRTILLTTHYMDEADVLGDRIAIMAEGRVKCCGTPMFLKRAYGSRYRMTVVKEGQCQSGDVTDQVINFIPGAKFITETNLEIQYSLPDDSLPIYHHLLKYLEENGPDLHVSSFGLTATSMEDVFMGSAKRRVSTWMRQSKGNIFTDKLFTSDTGTRGLRRVWHQFVAVWIKNLLLFTRQPIPSLSLLLLPALLVSLGVHEDIQNEAEKQLPPVEFSPRGFQKLITPMWISSGVSPKLVAAYKDQLPNSEFLEISETAPDDYFVSYLNEHGREEYGNRMVLGVKLSRMSPSVLYYQRKAIHSLGISVQLITNAHVTYNLGPQYSVQSGVCFLNVNQLPVSDKIHTQTLVGMALAMALVPVIFINSLITERVTGAKHLQTLSGVHPLAYWLGTFAFDFLLFMTITATILGILTFNPENFISHNRWLATAIVYTVYGLAILPYLYVFQNCFSEPSRGVLVLLFINIFIGMILGTAVGILKLANIKLPSLFKYLDKSLSMLSPNYLNTGSFVTIMIKFDVDINGGFEYQFQKQNGVLKTNVYTLLVQSGISWLVLLMVDSKLHRTLW